MPPGQTAQVAFVFSPIGILQDDARQVRQFQHLLVFLFRALSGPAHVIENHGGFAELRRQRADVGRLRRDEVHLHGHPQRGYRLPAGQHAGILHVAVANGPAGFGRHRHFVNAQGDDALRPAVRQGAHAAGRILAQRVEQAGSFEIPRPRLMRKAVFQVAVIVLVGLRMHDDGVRQPGGLHQADVIFQRVGGGLVRRVRRVGDAVGIEEVNVGFDGRRRRGCEQGGGGRSQPQQRGAAGQGVSHGCCYSRWTDALAARPVVLTRDRRDNQRRTQYPMTPRQRLLCAIRRETRGPAARDHASRDARLPGIAPGRHLQRRVLRPLRPGRHPVDRAAQAGRRGRRISRPAARRHRVPGEPAGILRALACGVRRTAPRAGGASPAIAS